MRTAIATALTCALLLSCGRNDGVAGNGTNVGNAQATGIVVQPSGKPVVGAWVECVPGSKAPWEDRQPGWSDATGPDGSYRCTDLPAGPVGITAVDPRSGLSRWRGDTLSAGEHRDAGTDTLAASGRLRIALPPGTVGRLWFTGLSRSVAVQGEEDFEIKDIPAGWRGSVNLVAGASGSVVLDSGLHVGAGSRDSVGYTRRSVVVRVPLAGGLTQAALQVPLLVRLDSTWPGFAASLSDGSDLRLSRLDGRALPVSVGQWDRASRTGALWTLLDTLGAPGESFDLVVSWGLPVPVSPTTSPFAGANGWIAAWPLGDTGAVAAERLGTYPGTATGLATIEGVVGRASRFDGKLAKVVIGATLDRSLDLAERGTYTLSCWARLRSYGSSRYVLGQGKNGTHLKFQGAFGPDTNCWLASGIQEVPTGGRYALGHADTAVWAHLGMTVEGDSVALYVDGIRQTLRSGFDGSSTGKRAALFAIGAGLDTSGVADDFFRGDLAEVWVQKVARAPQWFRLVAENQRPGGLAARLVP